MTRWPLMVLPFLVAAIAPGVVSADPYEVAGVKLDVTAAPEHAEYMLGEPGYVLFKVANQSDRNLRLMVGGDYRNRLGRPDSFKIEVVRDDGKKMPQLDSGMQMGGIVHSEKLSAKGEYVFRLFLPQWATFEKPGRYTMTIRRKLELVPDDGNDAFRLKTDNVEVTTTATITIVPLDDAKMGKLIASLGAKIRALKPNHSDEQAEQMLTAMHDDRVIPHFIVLAEKPYYSPRITACLALGQYKNDKAFEALKKLLKTTADEVRGSATTPEGDESCAKAVRHWAIHGIGASPHPKALPLFWTFANDPYYGVRLWVVQKAAQLKTPEALAIIQKMTADENETVRNEAIRYQKLIAKEDSR
jgi:hypothetical protein